MSVMKSGQDYLEAILMIKEEKGLCRAVDVANLLGFSKASVSVAMAKLKNDGYITTLDDGSLSLTEQGIVIAEETLQKHHLLTKLLVKIGVSPETAEKDACLIEHNLSDETYEKLQSYADSIKL